MSSDAKVRVRKRLSPAALALAVFLVAGCLAPLLALTQSTSARALKPTHGSRSSHLRRHSPQASASSQSTNFASSKKSTKSSKSRHSKSSKSKRQKGQMTPTPDRIQEIQSALARSGYYKGEPNGKMNEETQDALKHFQEANGLSPSGKLDALTLEKLGLGSDTAGVSAPKQTPPPTPSQPHP